MTTTKLAEATWLTDPQHYKKKQSALSQMITLSFCGAQPDMIVIKAKTITFNLINTSILAFHRAAKRAPQWEQGILWDFHMNKYLSSNDNEHGITLAVMFNAYGKEKADKAHGRLSMSLYV